MSYLPVGLYAESLNVNSAIISALGSKAILPSPLTGCIKDFNRLWSLTTSDLLSNFGAQGHPVVSSVRHGNSFPLINEAILGRANLVGRQEIIEETEETDFGQRPTFIHVSYILPNSDQSSSRGLIFLSRIVALLECAILVGLSTVAFWYGLSIAALLLLCQASNIILLLYINLSAALMFANKTALEKDIALTAARGAAVDAHVIVENWNASNIDVVIGYSAQVHSLTNIPIKVKRWKIVTVVARLLSLVLAVQAALLAALVGSDSKQTWGSLIWLVSHSIMHLVASISPQKKPDMILEGQASRVIRVPPLRFSGRRAALAFIATLPGIEQRTGTDAWNWTDGFMPDNERRRAWVCKFSKADAEGICEESETWNSISEDTRRILREVYTARSAAFFKRSCGAFLRDVGLTADTGTSPGMLGKSTPTP